MPLATEHGPARRLSRRLVPRPARGGGVLRRSRTGERRRRRGRGRPDPARRPGVPRRRRARRDRAADLRALSHRDDRSHGGAVAGPSDDADLLWVCNPNNPTGAWVEPEDIVELARARARRRSWSSTRPTSSTGPGRARRGSTSCRTSSCSGRSRRRSASPSLRVGYALAHPDDRGAARPSVALPLRSPARPPRSPRPRCASPGSATSRRRSRSASACARLSSRPATTARRRRRTSSSCARTSPLGERLEAQGIVVRRLPGGHPRHGPPPVRERRAAARAGCRAGAGARTGGHRAPDDDRDRSPPDA